MKPKGIAVLTIAALLPMAGGRIARARVAYGAMGPTPLRARAVERALEGRALDEAGDRRRGRGGRGRDCAGERRHRQRLVPARDPARASAPPAARAIAES